MSDPPFTGPTCPAPAPAGDRVLLAHGEGARLTRRLIRDELLGRLDNPHLRPLGDGAVLPAIDGPLVVSADGYVVTPLFFPGGDIGKLAVHGTVNDLCVCGADPLYLALGLILEEGLLLDTLRRVIASVADAARVCGVAVVTGDTKVVPRGADQLFLHTTGVGRLRQGVELVAHRVRTGDKVLVSGTVGDHGLAVLAAREQLLDDPGLASDTAPLHEITARLLDVCGPDIHFLRDPTRGGVSAVLHEVAESAGCSITVEERDVPLSPATRGACELFGIDALYAACEGRLVAFVAPAAAELALTTLCQHPLGARAACVGEVTAGRAGDVLVRGPLGALRVLDEPSGAPLPRIC